MVNQEQSKGEAWTVAWTVAEGENAFLSFPAGGIMRQGRSYIGVLAPFCILATFILFTLTASYKPVIVIHGLNESPSDFQLFLEFISKTHPGTNVTVVDLYDSGDSLDPLWQQVEGFRRAIYPIMQNAADGVHLICYSQGGLICRALLSTTPDHNVDTFISLSSPQMGQYGAWKKNLLRISKLVLIGGPDDGVIEPWESSLFGFFDGYGGVTEMKSQPVSMRHNESQLQLCEAQLLQLRRKVMYFALVREEGGIIYI
ncbi:hypothetical protein JD844_013578 [Phrynosoma platyrhinos]|uniref:palmitoyl-CoA hydrolase n=1 Tax=Phrynosoma platyrhinos TaxID=52577 RepID=A0ABQ7TLH6_PHRPL|nr:hypothetical protein JD844_013578 [Phrynosoma platyrhinos]